MLTNILQNPGVDKIFAVYREFNICFCFLVCVKTTIIHYSCWFSHVWVNWLSILYSSACKSRWGNFCVYAHDDRNKYLENQNAMINLSYQLPHLTVISAAGRSHVEATECLYSSAHCALGDSTRFWKKCTYTANKHVCEPLTIHLSMLTGTREQFKSEAGSSKLLLPLGTGTM